MGRWWTVATLTADDEGFAAALNRQQREISDLRHQLFQAGTKLTKIREIAHIHARCSVGCDALLDIMAVLDDH